LYAQSKPRLSPTQFYTQSYLVALLTVGKLFIPTFKETMMRLYIKHYLVIANAEYYNMI